MPDTTLEQLYIYLVVRTDKFGWTGYESIVVAARDKDHARTIMPRGWKNEPCDSEDWTTPNHLRTTYLGLARPGMEPSCLHTSYREG